MRVLLLILLFASPLYAQQEDIAQYLQDISVTIKAGMSTGSGVLFTREVEGKKVNFVWTAAHVIDNLRATREVIDKNGQKRNIVEFKDAEILREIVFDGRKVGQIQMFAKVLKFSEADNGEDLALMMLRQTGFSEASTQFYLEKDIIPIGSRLFHVGSLLGQAGANSMTQGIMSQVGRVLQLGSGDGVVFDQCAVGAFPGSSGGGVFLAEEDGKGKYVGMLVRGAGEGFNLIVPMRRMKKFADRHNIMWALDQNIPAPTMEEILKMSIEDITVSNDGQQDRAVPVNFPFLIQLN